jgi:hypothetical protein
MSTRQSQNISFLASKDRNGNAEKKQRGPVAVHLYKKYRIIPIWAFKGSGIQ